MDYTVLAPNNKAFRDMAASYPEFANVMLDSEWNGHLRYLLLFHVIDTVVESGDLTDGMEIMTASSEVRWWWEKAAWRRWTCIRAGRRNGRQLSQSKSLT